MLKDFYCSAGAYDTGDCCFEGRVGFPCDKERCKSYRHKHPTPEEYKKEFGFEVPEDMPVWYIDSDDPEDEWMLDIYYFAIKRQRYKIVVACTPFIPSNSRRPEAAK